MVNPANRTYPPPSPLRPEPRRDKTAPASQTTASANSLGSSGCADVDRATTPRRGDSVPARAHDSEVDSVQPNPRNLRQEWKLSRDHAPHASGKETPPTPPTTTTFDAARDRLQQALANLKDRPTDGKRQRAAHEAQTALAQQPIPLLHRAVPVAREALRVGVVGSLPTFGVGRTLGVEVGKNSAALGLPRTPRAGVQWFTGAVGGAIGNLAGQSLATPLLDKLPRQFRPIDPAAVLPDHLVKKMNRVRRGWGDELRAAIAEQQREILRINSNTNIHFAEKAFSVATGVRLLSQQPGRVPNLAGSVAISSAVSTVAGGAVGLNMGVNMAKAEVRVPRMEALDRALASKTGRVQEDAIMQDARSLPLFYAHHTPVGDLRPPTAGIVDGGTPGQVRRPTPKRQHQQERIAFPGWGAAAKNLGADLRHIGESVSFRSGYLMQATAAPSAIGAVQPFVVAAMPNEAAARFSSVALPIVGIYAVLRPWFNALAGGIPAQDAAMRARRQKDVDAAAAPVAPASPKP